MAESSERLHRSYPADGVALIVVDNPPANSLDRELYEEFDQLIGELERDERVRAVVFTSAHPKIFVSGADLKKLGAIAFTRAGVAERVDRANAVYLRLQRLSKPTLAAIEGHAMGGGCELALALDFRFMNRGEGRIGLPEAGLGLIPAAGGTQRLARLIGRARAADLMMLARRLDADEAERIGLVSAACDDARAAALDYAVRLAAMPASSLRWIKVCLNDGHDAELPRALAVERTSAIEAFVAPEAAEGVAAFLEKRPPSFHVVAR